MPAVAAPPEVVQAVAAKGDAGGPSPPAADLSREGPYGVAVVHDAVQAPRPDRRTPTRLTLTATVPCVAPADPPLPGPPFPVVLMFNGFQARASQYAPFARRLASWGFVCLQYTAPPFTIVPDNVELTFARPAVDWLRRAVACESNAALHKRADLDRVLVAGHSRGAKLAALHYSAALRAAPEPGGLVGRSPYTGTPLVSAFLMDPVDNTRMTPESEAYPSACKALAAAGARVAITGAGVVGSTNPDGANWRRFWAAAAPGSWLGVLPRAGHTKWMFGPLAECWCLDKAFSGGSAARALVLEATAACMVAWFSQQLSEAARAAPFADPLASAASGAAAVSPPQQVQQQLQQEVRLAAAAVYGSAAPEAASPPPGSPSSAGGGGGSGSSPLPPSLAPWLSPLVAAGDFRFVAKGGAAVSHPIDHAHQD